MIKLKDLLFEGKYNYGCVMLYFNFPLLNKIQDAINPKDLYEEEGDRTFGLEEEPHCTLLYGIHDEDEDVFDDIKSIINSIEFGECKLYNVSLFQNNNDYDVLKFDVDGKNLHYCNKELKELPHQESEFPDYHPHLTIAYIKAGKGQRYANMLKGQEFELTPSYIVYSQPDGSKIKIKINVLES